MKTKNILLIALLVLLAGMASCKKDHDIPTGKVFNGGSGGGSTTDSLTISVTANPSEGGTVSGGGKYLKGKTCVVAASANEGYVFSSWTENGTQVSTSVSYSFTVDVDRTLVANFSVSTGNNFTITALGSPEYGGVISGSGNYQQGQNCTVTATAEAGYTFVNWTENGSQVSTEASYTFTVTGNRTLVANFTLCDYSNIILNEINGNDKFIEIYNSGTVAINLNGVYLEKDGMQNWVADNTVRIEAGDYLLLYSEDVQIDHPDWPEVLIFHSGLSAKKNIHVQLFAPAGVSIGDFNLTNIDLNGEAYGYVGNAAPASYSRNTDGNWYYAEATPGAANVDGVNIVLGLEGGNTSELFTITVSANPANGGTVSGGGTYQGAQSCTVTAVPANDYIFTWWYEMVLDEGGGSFVLVSSDANYTFTVNGDRTLQAKFSYIGGGSQEYVDLGLPSGLLWATCNVGANAPEEYGDYFAWGETEPKSVYNWTTYQYCIGSGHTLTKYCNNSSYGYNGFTDNLTTLLPEDDAATANWGSGWRMPTKEEWQELYNNTTHTWTTQKGVNGRLFTASNGNSLFLPAAGYRDNSSLYYAGSYGFYWSSSLNTSSSRFASYFYFGSDGYSTSDYFRDDGCSVRPVRSAQN